MTTANARYKSSPNRGSGGGGRRVAAVVGLAVVILLAGCSGDSDPSDITRPDEPLVTPPEDGSPGTDPAPEPTEAPAPEPTAAPEQPAPEPEPPTTTEPDEGDGTTTEEAIAVVLLILLIVAVIGGLIAWMTRRRPAPSGGQVEALDHRRMSISSRTRWVVDQGVPAFLGTADTTVLPATWASVNTAMAEVEQELNALAGSTGPEADRSRVDLAVALASLRGSLESGYGTRMQRPNEGDLVAATDRLILTQCDQVRRAVQIFELAPR